MIKNVRITSRKTTCVLLFIILFTTGITTSLADSVPEIPNTFAGTVKLANSSGQFDAPAGTLIEALIDNVIKGNATVSTPGSYFLNVNGTIDDDNKIITFKVNNMTAEQRSIFRSMAEPRILNLVVQVDTTAPEVTISDPQANWTLRYFENIIRGTVMDSNIQSAKITVKNELGDWIREYPLNLTEDDGRYKFIERVEFARGQNNTIELFALDRAGNTNITSITVHVRNNTYVNDTNVTRGSATIINARDESDTEVEFISNVTRKVTFAVTAITNRTLIDSVTSSSSKFGEVALGKIVEINLTGLNATNKSEVQSVIIRLFYTREELEVKGLDENKLSIYWYNTTSGNWAKLVKNNPEWVLDNGQVKVAGNNPGHVWVKVEHLSIFAIVGFSPVSIPTSTSSPAPTSTSPPSGYGDGGGGSGGGGGGGASAEDPKNIVVKEKYDLHIFKDKVTSYRFTNGSNPVMFINITGNTSAGEVNAAVEVLKGTSSLVKTQAPGTVYKNINMWVGTSGFAVPKNIKDAAIKFRVENSWLSSNGLGSSNIRLVKWDGSRWVQLETSELAKNSTYTYYEAKTNSFSPFAVTVLEGEAATSTGSESTPEDTGTPAATPTPGEKAPPTNLAIIIGVIVLIAAIITAVYIKRKDRPRS